MDSYIDQVARSAARVETILMDARNLRAAQDGKLKIDLSTVNLSECVNESLDIVKDIFTEKDITTVLSLDDINPHSTHITAERNSLIYSVITNLLTNAAKFSYRGNTVEIRLRRKGDKILLMIKDNGIGIPEDICANLFSSFEKTSRQGTAKEKGTGFGLPTVKLFVEMYGAKVSVKSKVETASASGHTEFVIEFLAATKS